MSDFSMEDVRGLGTILGVWAHPDDEAYLSAALMAAARREGQRVVVVTATKGEAGTWDEVRWPTSKMGEIREAELLRCLEILGVTEHSWLDVYDGTAHEVSLEEGIEKVLPFLDEVQPDTVLTFGPEGMTGHEDHKAVSHWTTEAFRRAGKPDASLYYATQTKAFADRWVDYLNRFHVFGPGTPPVTPDDEIAIKFEIPPDLLELKVYAVMAHDSQIEGMTRVFGDDWIRQSQQGEYFVRAAQMR
ncbi:MAG: PIG-L deacetylase family protein [Actinomycetota bacterium]